MASLTELCSICFTNIPKYTCPRCGCHTCSLECVKTHKKRARCSGVRDPAAYRKSNELATPASIDQDYNFITKVQRGIEKAEDEVADRGITLMPARSGRNAYTTKSRLEVELEACGVSIIKAPTGLSRSKQNKTHWDSRHKCVMWTIEWLLHNNDRVLCNVQGGRTVLDAFMNAVGRKGLQKKRKLEENSRQEEERTSKQTAPRAQPAELQLAVVNTSIEKQQRDYAHPMEGKDSQEVSLLQDVIQTSTEDKIASQMHFFLHRPQTSSRWTCLIPISSSTSISGILRDRTITEYPTIYVRHDAEDQLLPPLISEKNYEEQHDINVVPRVSAYGEEDNVTAIDAIPNHIDEKKVMEVLRKDLVS